MAPLHARAPLPVTVASEGMVVATLSVDPRDVAFVKGVVDASEGLAVLLADRGGDISIAAPADRRAELDELIRDLRAELKLEASS